MTYRERRLAKADRLREWSEKRKARSATAFDTAHKIADGIPFGQPILVGHHSEKHHRRDLDRIHNNMRNGIESEKMANSMASTADEIERQAGEAIYSDDPDAIEALTARIESLEAERARIKTINMALRKAAKIGDEATKEVLKTLTPKELADIGSVVRHQSYYDPLHKGFPPYYLQNLGGNINRQKARLANLKRATSPTAYRCMLARFASPCFVCGETIKKDTAIAYYPAEKKARHNDCKTELMLEAI